MQTVEYYVCKSIGAICSTLAQKYLGKGTIIQFQQLFFTPIQSCWEVLS